jgi:hypothetical protein
MDRMVADGRPDMIKLRNLFLIWAPFSIVMGVGFTTIPWGNPNGFHGIGFPFASVYWDSIDRPGKLVDYPNPYAPILNSAAFFLVGSVFIGVAWWVVSHLRPPRPSEVDSP